MDGGEIELDAIRSNPGFHAVHGKVVLLVTVVSREQSATIIYVHNYWDKLWSDPVLQGFFGDQTIEWFGHDYLLVDLNKLREMKDKYVDPLKKYIDRNYRGSVVAEMECFIKEENRIRETYGETKRLPLSLTTIEPPPQNHEHERYEEGITRWRAIVRKLRGEGLVIGSDMALNYKFRKFESPSMHDLPPNMNVEDANSLFHLCRKMRQAKKKNQDTEGSLG